jgi:hypothetical protein
MCLRPFSDPKMAGFASQTPKDTSLLSVAFIPLWLCAAGQFNTKKLDFEE